MATKLLNDAHAALPIRLKLIAACCDVAESSAKDARVAPLAAQITDWQSFARVVQRHQLLGSVAPVLAKHDSVPGDLKELWQTKLLKRSSISLRQTNDTVRLHRILTQHSVANLVIKGVPLGQRLYGTLIQKHSGDIDFLVRPEGIEDALDVLQDEGFLPLATGHRMSSRQAQAVARHYKEIALVNQRKEIIDLHWRLVQHPAILCNMNAFESPQEVQLGKAGAINTLSEANEFAYLCAHAALSDWRRFKWLCDVNALLAGCDDAQIEALVNHAATLGADRCALQCLALREVFWVKPMPPALRARITDAELRELIDFAMLRSTTPYRPISDKDRRARIVASAKAQRWLHPQSATIWDQLRPQLFALSDILALPLPSWLDWLYIPLRPFFWLKRQIIPDKLRQLSMRSYRPEAPDPPRGESQV